MRRKDLHPYVARAIALTGGEADFRDTTSPTWDGKRWHLARIKTNAHVLHEVAHWIVVRPLEMRSFPNYGLGTDPDDGPHTDQFLVEQLRRKLLPADEVAALRKLSMESIVEIVEGKCSLEEELAAIVSLRLLALSGLPWADEFRRIYKRTDRSSYFTPAETDRHRWERFWENVDAIAYRGVDLSDPLAPFARAKGVAA